MSIPIQLICIGSDQYALLEDAARRLNGVQTEFRFELIDQAQRALGLAQSRHIYKAGEVLDYLVPLRGLGGFRPFIIAFVNGPLESDQYRNLFGSVRADFGVSVVTTDGSGKYEPEAVRYSCFYLVRYVLSFLNPYVRSHQDPQRATCYFNFKHFKPDIRQAMDSGKLCDECRRKLGNQAPQEGAMCINGSQWQAIENMMAMVSGQINRAVVLKGGGIKGLAFASALIELQRFYKFDLCVGTSAGAIAAVLLSAGYKPTELLPILRDTDFRTFMDAPWWRVPLNLLRHKGMYRAKAFTDWLAVLLAKKIAKQGEVLMSDLNKALIFASRRGNGAISFETGGDRSGSPATFAARCSMSIPIFFTPMTVDMRRVYDGGLRANFPLEQFQSIHPYKPFIAVYLGSRDLGQEKGLLADLLDIAIDDDERQVVDANRDCVVEIDPSPISTLDFNLSDQEKEFLVQLGKSSALSFLHDRKLNGGPTQIDVDTERAKTDQLRMKVEAARKSSRGRRRIIVGAIAALGVGLGAAAFVWMRS